MTLATKRAGQVLDGPQGRYCRFSAPPAALPTPRPGNAMAVKKEQQISRTAHDVYGLVAYSIANILLDTNSCLTEQQIAVDDRVGQWAKWRCISARSMLHRPVEYIQSECGFEVTKVLLLWHGKDSQF
jgi:hypothetical protein